MGGGGALLHRRWMPPDERKNTAAHHPVPRTHSGSTRWPKTPHTYSGSTRWPKLPTPTRTGPAGPDAAHIVPPGLQLKLLAIMHGRAQGLQGSRGGGGG